MLERFAIGIPSAEALSPAAEAAPPLPRSRRRPRRRLGDPRRAYFPARARLQAASPSTPDPGLVDRRLRRAVASSPLILLIPGPRARALRTAGDAAVDAASQLSGDGREMVLVDLDPGGDLLPDLLGGAATEGIADVLFFGVSLQHAVRAVAGLGIRYLSAGAVGAEPERLFDHPRWPRVLAEANRRELTLLAFSARRPEELSALGRHAGGVLLLADPDEAHELAALLPEGVAVLGTVGSFPPPALAPTEPAEIRAPGVAAEETAGDLSTAADWVEDVPVGDEPPATPAELEAPAEPWTVPEPEPSEAEPVAATSRDEAAPLPPVEPSAEAPAETEPPLEGATPEAAASPSEPRPGWQARLRGMGPALLGGMAARFRARPAPDVEDVPHGPPAPVEASESDFEAALRRAVEGVRPPADTPASPDEPGAAEPEAGPEATSRFGRTLAEWLAAEEQRPVEAAPEPVAERLAALYADDTPEEAAAAAPERLVVDAAEAVDAPEPLPIEAEADRTADAVEHPALPQPESAPPIEAAVEDRWLEMIDAADVATPHALPGAPAEPAELEAPVAASATEGIVLPPVEALPPDEAEPAETEERLPAGRYTVPRTSPAQERVVHVAVILMLAYWTYYIGWRWLYTLNLGALWFSVPLALAETWGLLTAIFLTFTTWRLNHRTPTAPNPGLDVDVFITTFDEPIEVIRRTAISAREMRYPHRTYVLDDGRRDEIRAMAEELGIGYLRRDTNEHAKAGNLNHALQHTSGEFILQLDADHAPLPHMLDRLLGFFGDPKVAFVQTPQDFYNTDSFTSDVSVDERRIWEEQRLFFSVIQPGKDSSNSAFFCGSCAVIRRSALEEIGGFSTRSITEDIETSLLLHARGWKSVYHGESLAYGLAAGSADAFHTQHMRWAQGAMQVLRTFNPLTYPGLTLAQRIGYFYSLVAYVTGLQKLIFYLAPIVFFLTGVLPIRALDEEFLIRFFPYLLVSIVLVEMLSRGMGFTWIAERYQMAKFWTYTRALPTFFTRRPLRFQVTRKGPGRVSPATYAPHLVLMVLTALSVNWATVAYSYGWVAYSVDGWQSLAFQLNFLWALVNFVLAAYVVRLSIRLQERRKDHRFADRFPIDLRVRGNNGRLGERQIALTENLNASGLAFRTVKALEIGAQLSLTLPLSTQKVTVTGTVVHMRRDPDVEVPIYVHGVKFQEVSAEVRNAIEIHCAHHAVPIEQMNFTHTARVLSRGPDWMPAGEAEQRRRVRLPTWVLIGDLDRDEPLRECMAFLEEIGESSAFLILNDPVDPGTRIAFEVPGTGIRGEGNAVFARALETPIGVRFAVGVRCAPTFEQQRPSTGLMRSSRFRQEALTMALLVASALASPALAHGQAQVVLFGSAEADAEDQTLLLVGGSIQTGRMGLQPVAGVTVYRLTYPVDAGANQTINAVNPSLGLRLQRPGGALQASVGYLFLSSESEDGLAGPGGSRDGVTTDLMADYWGTGRWTAQALASFNWEDGYVWSRGRAARRIARLSGADVRLGGEVVLQGGGSGPGEDYQALQVGPMLQFQPLPSFQLILSGGGKSDNRDIPGRPEWFPYGKLEFVLVP